MDDRERISVQVIHPNVGLRKLSTNLQNQLAQPAVLNDAPQGERSFAPTHSWEGRARGKRYTLRQYRLTQGVLHVEGCFHDEAGAGVARQLHGRGGGR